MKRIKGTNTLYNVYDAGNFMTGKAFGLVGVKQEALLKGANASSQYISRQGIDTVADQKAISDGHNYKGVVWKK